MADEALFPPEFERRVGFMLEPLRRPRPLPIEPEERQPLLEAARDWLERFRLLITETRQALLDRALNPLQTSRQDTALLNPTFEPIPGWDWQAEPEFFENEPSLFDSETIERVAYLVDQLMEDADQPFFRELALLQVDRLDLLISLLKVEQQRLTALS
jgi:hypothetical protein